MYHLLASDCTPPATPWLTVHVTLHRPSPFNNFFHPKILVISSCFQPVSYIICIHWVYKFYFVQSSNPYGYKSEMHVKIFQYDDYLGYILLYNKFHFVKKNLKFKLKLCYTKAWLLPDIVDIECDLTELWTTIPMSDGVPLTTRTLYPLLAPPRPLSHSNVRWVTFFMYIIIII